jgi:hypothetical protein
LHSNEDLKFTLVYPSLKVVDEPLSCITNTKQDPSSESYDVHNQSNNPQDTQADIIPSISNLIPSKIQERYRPLRLTNTLHDFLVKHYKYLPKFDGESDKIIAEKHIQAFENFIDLFEVEHDDFYM